MHYIRRPSWWLPESAAAPETVFWNRRAFLKAGAGAAALGAVGLPANDAEAQLNLLFGCYGDVEGLDTKAFDPKPATNAAYADAGRPPTPEEVNGANNNFYEFLPGRAGRVDCLAKKLPTEKWEVVLDGEVEAPVTLGMEEILAQMPLEERVVRHRCVEAWSMVAPWIGFPIAALMDKAKPLSSAKYVRFESFDLPKIAPGQKNRSQPWPYIEGLTIEEAAHPLAFMVVGAYGKILPAQFGAPIRMHVPWKYGFKHNKSITRITFTSKRPVSYWEEVQGFEYGFWANVNPGVPHRRWSQASERDIATGRRIPTQIYNGYGEEVAGLYADKRRLGDALFR